MKRISRGLPVLAGMILGIAGILSIAASQRRVNQAPEAPLPPPTPRPAAGSSRELGMLLSSARLKVQSAIAQATKAPTPTPGTGGFALPFSGSAAAPNAPAFAVTNTDPGGPQPGAGSSTPLGISGTGVIGVQGNSPSATGTGMLGIGLDGIGVSGYTIGGQGLYGNSGPTGTGLFVENRGGSHARLGTPEYSFRGGFGTSTDTFIGSKTNALYAKTDAADGQAVLGIAENGGRAVGVYGISASGWAGYFRGRVNVTGTLTAASKQFTIDHPLYPKTKTLSHACVESDALKNVYDGIAVCDGKGRAVVKLPDWLEALNRDFRYQLTCIGGHAPVYIAREIEDGRFTIAGGRKGLKVSWQITGIRKDAHALAHPLRIEADK